MNAHIFPKWILLAVLILFSASLVMAQDRAIRVRKRGDDANIKKSRRVALVIGNSNYKVAPLRNPANDAKALAGVLRESGFQVDLLIDANLRKMDRSIRKFGKKLALGGVGLFFYAGHGMQVKGINYLIPIGTKIEEEDEVKYEAVDANRILSKMSSAQNDLNLVFLDACRNNPFKRSFRSARQGLAPMDAPKGAMVSFATAPGNVAADGSGKHSPFTAHLLKQMRVPGLEVGQMMRRVRMGVQQETGGKQTPWELSSMTGNFYFFPAKKKMIAKTAPVALQPAAPRVAAAAPRSMDEEEEFWQAVKGSKVVEDLQSYLEAYPKGRFAGIARLKIRQLRRRQTVKSAALVTPKPAPPPRVAPQNNGKKLAIYPVYVDGIARDIFLGDGHWWLIKWVYDHLNKIYKGKIKISHSFYARADPARTGEYTSFYRKAGKLPSFFNPINLKGNRKIKNDTWSGFFSKSPNESNIFETGRTLGIDLVFLYQVNDPGECRGSFKMFLFDVRSSSKYQQAGRWECKRFYPDFSSGISELFNKYFRNR